MRIKHQIFTQLNRYYVLCGVLFIYLCWPSRFAMIYYENYNLEEIENNLIRKTLKNSTSKDRIHCVRNSFELINCN